MKRNVHYEIMKRDELEFVYAVLFEDGDDVFVKFGRSCRPYVRIQQVVQGAPFALSSAVFAQAGSKALATKIERSLGARLQGYKTRGEWYRFKKTEGRIFSSTVKVVFARITGRALAWTVMDVEKFQAEMVEAARKWQGRAHRGETLACADDAA